MDAFSLTVPFECKEVYNPRTAARKIGMSLLAMEIGLWKFRQHYDWEVILELP